MTSIRPIDQELRSYNAVTIVEVEEDMDVSRNFRSISWWQCFSMRLLMVRPTTIRHHLQSNGIADPLSLSSALLSIFRLYLRRRLWMGLASETVVDSLDRR